MMRLLIYKILSLQLPDFALSKIPLLPPRTLNFAQTQGVRGSFLPPEYDLVEIGIVEDVDGYVRQAFKKKAGLMFKEGLSFVGKNEKTVQYVKVRLAQIARASGIPTVELLKRIAVSLIRTSNAYLVKSRNVKASGGKVRNDPTSKRSVRRVAAYFPAAPETMSASLSSGYLP